MAWRACAVLFGTVVSLGRGGSCVLSRPVPHRWSRRPWGKHYSSRAISLLVLPCRSRSPLDLVSASQRALILSTDPRCKGRRLALRLVLTARVGRDTPATGTSQTAGCEDRKPACKDGRQPRVLPQRMRWTTLSLDRAACVRARVRECRALEKKKKKTFLPPRRPQVDTAAPRLRPASAREEARP